MFHGFTVSNLTDQYYVRRLAQGILQGNFIGFGIDSDLPLCHQAIAVIVHEFDRVFDGDDVAMGISVTVVHHRCQRSRFTGAGTTDKNHQPALGHRDILQNRWQAQFLETWNMGIYNTQYQARAATLDECIDTKTGYAG